MFWLTRRELISALFITRVTGVLDGFCTSSKKNNAGGEHHRGRQYLENGPSDTPVKMD
jgi:hypothetical protein